MAITVGNLGTIASGNTSIEVSAPSGISNGDLLVIFAGASASSGDLTLSVDESGWTIRAAGATTNGVDRSLMIATKVASSESGTYTVSTVNTASISARMVAFSGVHADVLDQTTPTAVILSNTNTSAVPPAITTQTADALVLTLLIANDAPNFASLTQPTNHTLLYSYDSVTPFAGVSYRAIASPATESPTAWGSVDTDASADTIVATIAFKAAASATKKLKLLVHPSAASETGVEGWVLNPAGTSLYGKFTGASFTSGTGGDTGYAVLKVDVADFSGSALTTSDAPLAVVRNADDGTTMITGSVIEE